MEELRNLPEYPAALVSLIQYCSGSVVSMALSGHPDISVTLFAFDEEDGISTEYYLGDTLYLVLEGEMPLQTGGQTFVLSAGECVRVPAKAEHAIGGEGRFKLLQITFHSKL